MDRPAMDQTDVQMIEPYYTTERFTLYNGDCLAVLGQLPDCSVDAIVTDPPAGISFMSKDWDHHKGGRDAWVAWLTEIMRECLRVLKPGGHALVWALPRTSHWTGWAIESAGFEVRDRVSHLFGSGFPKSLDVSRAIDGYLDVEPKVIGSRSAIPGVAFEQSTPYATGRTEIPVTEAGSWAARQWQGYGTALKPACEDWWLCRKPLNGTVAENVLVHGTGGLNIDGCRVDTNGEVIEPVYAGRKGPEHGGKYGNSGDYLSNVSPLGRWPANITTDGSDEVVGLFPESATGTTSNYRTEPNYKNQVYGRGMGGLMTPDNTYTDTGSAARFFYTAKPDKADREQGLQDLPRRSAGEVTDRADGSDGLNSPRAGAGRNSGARNHHPTVKATSLMRWLCRLITPPLGVVLDPFCGSGSTGKAAMLEGFRFIGIELSAEYCELSQRRIEAALVQQGLFTPEQLVVERDKQPSQTGLFTTGD